MVRCWTLQDFGTTYQTQESMDVQDALTATGVTYYYVSLSVCPNQFFVLIHLSFTVMVLTTAKPSATTTGGP